MTTEISGEKPDNEEEMCKIPCADGILWWAMLMVAVLAVPGLGIIVAVFLPLGELGQVIALVLTCWASIWLGMWLMKKSRDPKAGRAAQTSHTRNE